MCLFIECLFAFLDMAMFQYQRKPDLIEKLLSVMVKKKPDDPKVGLHAHVRHPVK